MKELLSLLNPGDTAERCGLIVDGEIVEITNVHPEPTKGFRMNPVEMLDKIELASASWHTHPATTPTLSEEDYAGFLQWPNLVHHIIGVRGRETAVESYAVSNGLVVKL